MVFRGKITRWFRKSKYDLLLVFHYDHWCILLNNKVIGYFRLGSPYWARFYRFDPLTLNFNTLDTQKAKRIFWAMVHHNPLWIVVCSLFKETGKQKHKRPITKKVYISPTCGEAPLEPIATNFGNSLYLTEVINRSEFGVDYTVVSAL